MPKSELEIYRELIHHCDEYTGEHCDNVTRYALYIAEKLGWDHTAKNRLKIMAETHDIGKIGISKDILTKPGRLTQSEYEQMKKHTTYGSNLIRRFAEAKDPKMHYGALYHHERWDGRGYPTGAKGSDIPIEGRIIGVADAYDAMTSDRCYRKHLSDSEVLHELQCGRGTQFDPDLADIMIEYVIDKMTA